MPDNIKSVLVALTKEFGSVEVSSATGYGLSLAQAAGAHLTVQAASQRLQLRNQDVSRMLGGLVGSANAQLRRLAEESVERARGEAQAAGVVATIHAPHLRYPDLMASFVRLAHANDLTVIDAEPEAIHPDRDLIQALLVNSGRPILIVPPGQEGFRARRIVVAWDGSGRAARAVHDALPFLRDAEAVEVVAVTGEKDLPDTLRGTDLAPHLSRHGVPVEVNVLAAPGGDVARALRDEADRFGADMIVMGGYVHSRLRQLIFGGVTQALLKVCPAPLLMSY